MPARLIGARVRVALSASGLEVFDGSRRVAAHPRLTTRGGCVLELDHYLEILLGKPGALPGSTALAQARAAGRFTTVHEAFWADARHKHGDAAGTRALIEVLLLHRRLPAAAVLTGIRAALGAGSVSVDVVAIEARKHATTGSVEPGATSSAGPRRSRAAVVTLDARRQGASVAALPTDQRPTPSVADYDQLLTHRGGQARSS